MAGATARSACIKECADAWVRAIADGGYAAAVGFSRLQSGLLARYAFGSLIAVAVVVLVRLVAR